MSGSDNTSVTKGQGTRKKERERGVDEERDEEQDYRANREALVVDRLSACLYEPLLPVYVLFTPRSIDPSTSFHPRIAETRLFRFIRYALDIPL